MEKNKKVWCHSRNGEEFSWEEYETREEAIIGGKVAYGGESFYIGVQGERFTPFVDVDVILENLQERDADEFGDLSKYCLDEVVDEDREELQRRMQVVYDQWAKETDNEQNFFKVREIERIGMKGRF